MRVFLYRVQDATGRGPWRPGLSRRWLQLDAPVGRLSETVMDLIPVHQLRALPRTHHYGCGCRSLAALMAWFLPAECERLRVLGFFPVKLQVDNVVVESPSQVLFARVRPLAEGASRLNWPKA